jgi:hypothetical protein
MDDMSLIAAAKYAHNVLDVEPGALKKSSAKNPRPASIL